MMYKRYVLFPLDRYDRNQLMFSGCDFKTLIKENRLKHFKNKDDAEYQAWLETDTIVLEVIIDGNLQIESVVMPFPYFTQIITNGR